MAQVFGQPLFTALIADQGNNRLRMQILNTTALLPLSTYILPNPPTSGSNNTISTFAGAAAGYADGVGTAARFNSPYGVASYFAAASTTTVMLWVSDTGNNAIRAVNFSSGLVTTLVGNTSAGSQDTISPSASMTTANATNQVTFSGPTGIASVDLFLFVCDTLSNRIRVVIAAPLVGAPPVGTTYPVAGGGLSRSQAGSALVDGDGTSALFNAPTGLVWDGNLDAAAALKWTLYVCDTGNNAIRQVKVTAIWGSGFISTTSTILGGGSNGMTAGYNLGYNAAVVGRDVLLNAPKGISTVELLPGITVLFIADTGNAVTRLAAYDSSSGVANWTAAPLTGGSGGPVAGFANGINASFNAPTSVFITSPSFRMLLTVDSGNNALRRTVFSYRPRLQ